MILIVDNYDSFVYNISRYLLLEGQATTVVRDGDISVALLKELSPAAIVISPGPGNPTHCPGSLTTIEWANGRVPLLGICLGHQCLGYAHGMRIDRAMEPMHGRASSIYHDGVGLFRGLNSPLTAGRYHSLIVQQGDGRTDLRVDAHSEQGEIMAVADERGLAFGIQFHPESVLTPQGHDLIRNFLAMAGG